MNHSTNTTPKKTTTQSLRKSAIVLGSRVSSCISKRSDTDKRPSRPSVRLIDPCGVDLTPLPLLNDDRRIRDEKEFPGSTEPSASLHSTSSLHITNPFAFTRSYMSGSSPTGDSHSEASDENADHVRAYAEVKTLVQPPREFLSEAELNKVVDVVITETDTFWIFDRPPVVMSQDSEDASFQIKRNAAYKALVASRLGNDRYMERGMNTFNSPVIPKSVQTKRILTYEKSTLATVWDMADTFQLEQEPDPAEIRALDSAPGTELIKVKALGPQLRADDGGPVEGSTRNLLHNFSSDAAGPGSIAAGSSTTPKDTMTSNSESDLFGFRYSVTSQMNSQAAVLDVLSLSQLREDMNRMERALNMNTYYEKLLKYEELHLRSIMAPTVLDRSDTDPSSTGARIPGITAAPTFEDNSVAHPAMNAQSGPTTKRLHSSSVANGVHSAGSASQTATAGGQNQATTARSSDFHTEDKIIKAPHTYLLWRYQSSLTKGRNISDMAWNKENPNILAVGYGQFEFDNQRNGMVCCWSPKYIEYPERFYETPSGVTAVGWSKIHSNLLAVGMFSGVIYVFDVRKNDPIPVIDTTHAAGRHFGAVRKIQWVVRESGRAENLSEVLVSVSSDGRVTEWFVRKGFDSTGDCDYHCDLMVLKRSYVSAPGVANKPKRNDSLISRTAFGTCIAFNKKEQSIYVVGTEEGPIHKCSCSYNEQYLDTFFGHTASVYEIEWSPFLTEVFLSCSADWTIKLWHLDHQTPLINIQTNVNMVSSISWSPRNSVIFASSNEGALELWNLDNSTIDPFVIETVSSDANMTSVLFSEFSESVLVGDNQGTVHVYHLVDFPDAPPTPAEQATRLNDILQTCIGDQHN
ncbi:unnamed protein product [Calicophoron daubneyi]|uniref:Dynein axonemal intermediate chain 4 n=1 Tax=Calicophoron daubneyi TaxID=300641 RepID=A0AAV2TV11_CALDB